MTLAEYLNRETENNLAFKRAVSSQLKLVTPEDITILQVIDSKSSMTTRWMSLSNASSTLTIVYTIKLVENIAFSERNTTVVYHELVERLFSSVNSGAFIESLQQIAGEMGLVSFTNTITSITSISNFLEKIINSPQGIEDDDESDSNRQEISLLGIIGIVIGAMIVIVGIVCIVLIVRYYQETQMRKKYLPRHDTMGIPCDVCDAQLISPELTK